LLNNKFLAIIALSLPAWFAGSPAGAVDRGLGFALSGVVEKVLVREGQMVNPGQPMVVLDTVRIDARLKAVKAEMTVSQGLAELAARRFDYAQEQFDAVALSKVELDTARIERDEARARLQKATAQQTVLQWRKDRSTLQATAKGLVKSLNAWPGMIVNLRNDNPVIVVISGP
jgi:multidrug efflux pump subunit AcrA (membrane-fusion protein)